MTTKPYDRVTIRPGVEINGRTAAMLAYAERLLGNRPLTIMQGSYNAGGVAASGGTHDGGGVVDVWLPGVALGDVNRVVVRRLRQAGFAAWYRPELWQRGKRVWGAHIHAVAIGDRDLAPAAAAQVVQFKAGQDGLAGHGPDTYDGPKVSRRTWDLVRRRVRLRMAQRDLERWLATHTATGEPKP